MLWLKLTSIAAALSLGLGYHEVAAVVSHPDKVQLWAKFTMIFPLLYLAAVLFAKLAILAMYFRIFTKASDRIACWVLVAVLVASWFANTVAAFLICIPLEYLWNRDIPGGHCFDINSYYRWSSLSNILTDLLMLGLPLPVIWKLHTSRNIKIGLTITFATGSM